MPVDPGSSFATALNIGNLSGNPNFTFSNFVGGSDTDDYLRFFLSGSSSLRITLSSLENDADILLLNSSGQIVGLSVNPGTEPELITADNLAPGTYFIRIYTFDGGATDYVFGLQGNGVSPPDPGSTLNTALDLGGYNYTLHTRTNTVNQISDPSDLYRFELNGVSDITLTLSNLNGNADVALLNSQGTVIASDIRSGTQTESIARTLVEGVYYARVSAAAMGTISYTLNLGVSLSDNAGNTLATARQINSQTSTLSGTFTFNDFLSGTGVNGADTLDVYRFTFLTRTDYNIALTGLSSDVDILLIQDRNNNGLFDDGEIVASSILVGTTPESIAGTLDAGTYFILVAPFSQAASPYTLTVSAAPQDFAGNSFAQSRNIGSLVGDRRFNDFVGVSDTNDYYVFTLPTTSDFRLDLTLLQADADVHLLSSTGSLLEFSINSGVLPETITRTLAAGTYYVRVFPFLGTATNPLNTNTNYQLSLSAIPTLDGVGNTLTTAFNAGLLSGTRSFNEFIGGTDPNDFYRFTLATISNFSLSLSNLTADADVELIRDFNNNGIVDAGEVIAASFRGGAAPESISRVLAAGTYFVRVYPFEGRTGYNLTLGVTPLGDGSLATATNLGLLTTTRTINDAIGDSDPEDYYRFSLNNAQALQISLTGLTADADLDLIRDVNNNGIVDPGDLLASSFRADNAPESIFTNLTAGTYFVRVYQFTGNTNYTLTLSPLSDTAGSTLATALNLQTLTNVRTVSETIGAGDTVDLYRFNLNTAGTLDLTLVGNVSDLTAQLIQDLNNNGVIENNEILGIATPGVDSFGFISLASSLNPGVYFVRVLSNSPTFQPYELTLGLNSGIGLSEALSTPTSNIAFDGAGNTLLTARNLGILTSPLAVRDAISIVDLNDYYRFSLTSNTVVNVLVNGLDDQLATPQLADDVNIELIRDTNGNGIVDAGEVLRFSRRARGLSANHAESINAFLSAGTYFIRVYRDAGDTGYTLNIATDSPNSRTSDHFGFGLVNAASAVARAIGQSTPFAAQPYFGDTNHWGVNMVNAPEAWARGYTGQGVIVAVLDTGVDYNHPELDSRIWFNSREVLNGRDDDGNGFRDDVIGWDFAGRDNNPQDSNGHGTHVAGTIAAERNGNGFGGITGVAYNARIMPVTVIGDLPPDVYHQALANGIRYAVNNGARVINLSLRTFGTATARSSDVAIVRDAVSYATSRGAVVVVAAGNFSETQSTFPALYARVLSIPGVISVGAVDRNARVSAFSNRAWGNQINYVVAPGEGVFSSVPNNRYESFNGTSMAAPHVAGVAALMLSANPWLTPTQVVSILTATANPNAVTV